MWHCHNGANWAKDRPCHGLIRQKRFPPTVNSCCGRICRALRGQPHTSYLWCIFAVALHGVGAFTLRSPISPLSTFISNVKQNVLANITLTLRRIKWIPRRHLYPVCALQSLKAIMAWKVCTLSSLYGLFFALRHLYFVFECWNICAIWRFNSVKATPETRRTVSCVWLPRYRHIMRLHVECCFSLMELSPSEGALVF